MSENNYLQRAEKLMEINRFSEAIPLLTKAHTENPQNYRVVCSLSYCFSELRDNDKSLQYAEKAIVVNPEEEWAYRLKGIQLIRKGKFGEALKYAKKSVDCEPENEITVGNYAIALLNNNCDAEAFETVEKLKKMAPDSAQTYYISGLVYLKSNRYVEAEKDLRQALKIFPEFAEARNSLAIAILRQSEKSEKQEKEILQSEAVKHFSDSVKLEPNNQIVIENFKQQFYTPPIIFNFIYFIPLFVAGFLITPIFTFLLSGFIFLITTNQIYQMHQHKKGLSNELKILLKPTSYAFYAGQVCATFVFGWIGFYKKIWLQTLFSLALSFLYYSRPGFLSGADGPLFGIKILFWLNSLWIFNRIFTFVDPKQNNK